MMKKIKLRELLPMIVSIFILGVFLIGITRAATNGTIGGLFNYYNNISGWDYNIGGGYSTGGYRLDAKNIYPANFGLNKIEAGTGVFINKVISAPTGLNDSNNTLTTKKFVEDYINANISNITGLSCPSGQYLQSFNFANNNATCISAPAPTIALAPAPTIALAPAPTIAPAPAPALVSKTVISFRQPGNPLVGSQDTGTAFKLYGLWNLTISCTPPPWLGTAGKACSNSGQGPSLSCTAGPGTGCYNVTATIINSNGLHPTLRVCGGANNHCNQSSW